MSADDDPKRILCVGLLCLDIITVCDGYPQEDTDQRCLDLIWQRGGNASNSCTALSVLGECAEYMGVITDSKEHRFLNDDLMSHGIRVDNCVLERGLQTPTSAIISNIQNASRTILSYQTHLPEVKMADFGKIDLRKYKWIHFEGRPSVDEIKKMLKHIDEYNSAMTTSKKDIITTSVELEKRRENLAELRDKADVVFISKEYAQWHDLVTMETAVDSLITKCRPGASLICPWGDKGAAARTFEGQLVTSPVFAPDALVDTLAAGDTFIGASIAALSRGDSLQDAVTYASKVAGCKCGIRGWADMKEKVQSI